MVSSRDKKGGATANVCTYFYGSTSHLMGNAHLDTLTVNTSKRFFHHDLTRALFPGFLA